MGVAPNTYRRAEKGDPTVAMGPTPWRSLSSALAAPLASWSIRSVMTCTTIRTGRGSMLLSFTTKRGWWPGIVRARAEPAAARIVDSDGVPVALIRRFDPFPDRARELKTWGSIDTGPEATVDALMFARGS